MTTDQTSCDSIMLSRFFDKELGPGEHARIDKHLKYCPACQKVLRANQSISSLLSTGLEEALSHADVEDFEERVLDLIQRKRVRWWMKLTALFMCKKFYVPAAAVATVLILFFSFVRRPAPEPGPSAIIKSFTGEISSVMIIQTPQSHQTILWFNETLIPGDEDDEIQEA
jgi:anti-sigma factor RsiW